MLSKFTMLYWWWTKLLNKHCSKNFCFARFLQFYPVVQLLLNRTAKIRHTFTSLNSSFSKPALIYVIIYEELVYTMLCVWKLTFLYVLFLSFPDDSNGSQQLFQFHRWQTFAQPNNVFRWTGFNTFLRTEFRQNLNPLNL